MNQDERRKQLISYFIEEEKYEGMPIGEDEASQKRLLRGLMNVRPAGVLPEDIEMLQDDYLQEELRKKGIVHVDDFDYDEDGLALWQGDITRLDARAIVNAANSGMTGCWQPNHSCIDNAIHTYAGCQLRKDCNDLMEAQGHPEPVGQTKMTPAYNLPCSYVLHTVGPIVRGPLTEVDKHLLAQCYRACLDLANEKHLKNIAFCCISTGVFGFPQKEAADIAVDTVRAWKQETGSAMKVIFNVFKDEDLRLYEQKLGQAH